MITRASGNQRDENEWDNSVASIDRQGRFTRGTRFL